MSREILEPFVVGDIHESQEQLRDQLLQKAGEGFGYFKALQHSTNTNESERILQELDDVIRDITTALDYRKWLLNKITVLNEMTAKLNMKPKRKARRSGVKQPPIESHIRDVLQKTSEPLHVDEIAKRVVSDCGYVTASQNFNVQIRGILYKNAKGWFTKTSPGYFKIS